MKKLVALFAVTAVAALGLAACGDDDGDSDTTAADTTTEATTDTAAADTGGGAGGTIDISAPADGSFSFDQTDLTSAPGEVTVTFDNPAQLSHDVVIESEDGEDVAKTDLISESTASTTANLTPGTYTFYCDVPGHREGGMEGTLTVK